MVCYIYIVTFKTKECSGTFVSPSSIIKGLYNLSLVTDFCSLCYFLFSGRPFFNVGGGLFLNVPFIWPVFFYWVKYISNKGLINKV